eukprot:COSAG01_NODE_7545_length_3157_cov_5.849902_1_plen_182_part_00
MPDATALCGQPSGAQRPRSPHLGPTPAAATSARGRRWCCGVCDGRAVAPLAVASRQQRVSSSWQPRSRWCWEGRGRPIALPTALWEVAGGICFHPEAEAAARRDQALLYRVRGGAGRRAGRARAGRGRRHRSGLRGAAAEPRLTRARPTAVSGRSGLCVCVQWAACLPVCLPPVQRRNGPF